jgi:hypothetical protein
MGKWRLVWYLIKFKAFTIPDLLPTKSSSDTTFLVTPLLRCSLSFLMSNSSHLLPFAHRFSVPITKRKYINALDDFHGSYDYFLSLPGAFCFLFAITLHNHPCTQKKAWVYPFGVFDFCV